MTHLFLVKSWITYLVARAIIRKLGIDPADAVLLAVRGFDVEDCDLKVVRLPYGPGEPEPFPKLTHGWPTNFLQTLPRLHRFDRFITDATAGRPFHYYSTNTRQRYNRAITTHPRCEGFSFIENGLFSYRTQAEAEALYPSRSHKILDRLYYRNRIRAKSYYDPGYSHVYGVGPLAFPGFERRIELPDTFATPSTAPPLIDGSQIEIVLVFDGLSAHRLISLAAVMSATRRLFEHFREHGVRRVHYKYHPAQTHAGEDREIDAQLGQIAKDIQVERMPESVILEELAYAHPHIHFYVNVSSVAVYVAQAGCRVSSYARYVAECEPGYDERIDGLPTSWKQSVDLLEP